MTGFVALENIAGSSIDTLGLCPVDLDVTMWYVVEIGFGAEKKTVSVDGEGLSAPQFGIVHRRASVFVIRQERPAGKGKIRHKAT